MNSSIFIDPKIDLDSEENVQIIVQFKTRPAVIQVKLLPNLTIEKARQLVEESHRQFQQDVVNYLYKNQIEYVILNRYKEAYNGVAMKLKGKDIKYLLQSNEIGAIYMSQIISIPPKPNDPRYQI
ncbi:protease inhibitor I9 family protein [Paucisalibacillus sp. EB02]|uniref:protease inhibitor I9 family protein n=1 Tax=Paucisalibacillus sp. EB02 TaxID=1347087 RepID=UPI0004B0F86A|nr:protease inhibitor I9 family protein [Paucisalibacillus sp. EB02]